MIENNNFELDDCIIANIISYNPIFNELVDKINKYSTYFTHIIIVNNSEDDFNYFTDNLTVINLSQNKGIAYAQSLAMELSIKLHADFIVQLDQDSFLEKETLFKLYNSFNFLKSKNIDVGLIGICPFNLHSNRQNKALFFKGTMIFDDKYSIVTETLSSGSLIPISTIKQIGFMENSLFIDSVDFEYCWRIRLHGLQVIRDNKAIMNHEFGEGSIKFLGVINIKKSTAIRNYYQFRNFILMTKRHYVPIHWKISNFIKFSMKLLIFPIIYKFDIKRMKYIYLGIIDGINNKYGSYFENHK